MLYYVATYFEDYYILLFTLVLLCLFMYACFKRERNGKIARIPELYIMAGTIFAISILDFAEYQLSLLSYVTIARKLIAMIGYMLRPLLGFLAVQTLEKDLKSNRILWIPAVINIIVYLNMLFDHLVVWYTPDNVFRRGPLYGTVFIISLLYCILMLVKAAKIFRMNSHWEAAILVAGVVGIGIAVLIDAFSRRNTLMFPVLAIALSFYVAYLMRQESTVRDLESQLALQEQQNQLMMSQIQPHFLYNTLATAAYLCEDDPELAEHTILQFSEYLRQNMKTIGNNEPVLFEDEIDHTKIYTEIEMLRFDNIEVNYNLEDMNFRVPALSIQPMVENAIRHGVRSRQHGVINVHSYRDGDEHVVVIADNGIGFDTSAPPKQDRPHIGVANVKKRIAGMAHGTMTIDSVIGQGTTITIRIPDEGKNVK